MKKAKATTEVATQTKSPESGQEQGKASEPMYFKVNYAVTVKAKDLNEARRIFDKKTAKLSKSWGTHKVTEGPIEDMK